MFVGNKNITANIATHSVDLIVCGYFCIGFIEFMWKIRNFLKYTNLFSPNDCERNDKIILKYFQ